MNDEFCEIFREIIESGDEAKMKVLGKVVKKMMFKMIDTSPTLAREYIDELNAVRWKNYLTQKEAQNIVANMNPRAYWNMMQWENAMEEKGYAVEELPHYNKCALFTTMDMISSDHGETLSKAMNTDKAGLFDIIYHLAVDKLKDRDGVFDIRGYFGL